MRRFLTFPRPAHAALLLAAAVLPTLGCIDIQQSLTFEKNLSGKAGFSMNFNLEPLVGFMVQMQRSMAGKTGAPTAAELAAARSELLASGKTTSTGDFEQGKKEFANMLPQGVSLLDASFKEDGLKFAANFAFGFDNISKLSQIKFPKGVSPGPRQPGEAPPMESPFGGLQFVDEGTTLLLSSPAENPMAEQQAKMGEMPIDAAMKKQMAELLQGLRAGFRITAPFAVVEHNAHRRDGNTLIWEFDVQTLEKLTPAQANQGVRVRYRK